jgi:hypothetical protein
VTPQLNQKEIQDSCTAVPLLIQLVNSHTYPSMSSLLNFGGMASSKKEKHYANRSARRHSGEIIISQSKKSKKDKDTDTESLSSSTPSSADTVTTPESKKCPLRFVLAGLFESGAEADGKKAGGCPLRRVQLWHTIPLCLLAIINLLLVIIALLGLAGYRITMGVQGFLVNLAKSDLDCDPYDDSLPDTDDGATLVAGKEK